MSTALVFSLLLHAALVAWLQTARWVGVPEPALPALLDVDLLELPVPRPQPVPQAAPQDAVPVDEPPAAARLVPESRIVPMPEAGMEIPSEEARFLSDRDNVVERESVRRGDSLDLAGQDDPGAPEAEKKPARAELPDEPVGEPPPPAAPDPAVSAAASSRPAVSEPRVAAPPAPAASNIELAQLLPRPRDIAAVHEAPPAAREKAPQRDLLPGRHVRFSSGSGIATLLPSVRDGDVTLLNTKAHAFAPFVRRVAVRVFQHLQIRLLEAARTSAAGSGTERAVVRATMRPDGSFRRAELRESRSDTRLSVPRVLVAVVEPRIFFDENPPPGAASADGDIHFDLTVELEVHSDAYRGESGRRVPLTQFEGYFGTALLE